MRDRVLDGRSLRELSIKYEITESHLSIITNSPLWLKEEAILHDLVIREHQTKLLSLVPTAIKTLGEIVERKTSFDVVDPATGESKQINVVNPPASRLRAADTILKVSGVSKEEERGDKSIVIQLFKPKWDKSNSGEVIEIEVQR